MNLRILAAASLSLLLAATPALADTKKDKTPSKRFTAERVFDMEYAADPQISPDGKTIVYVRRSMDRLTDRDIGQLWSIDTATGNHRPLIVSAEGASSPRWSPDGSRLVYATSTGGKPEMRVYYPDTGRSHPLAQFLQAPSHPVWSPDGKFIAFSMFVPGETPSFAKRPQPPKAANGAIRSRCSTGSSSALMGRVI